MITAIGYIRVSTVRQGKSGLGLEAQQAALARFAEAEGYNLIQTFKEVETGKGSDAPPFRQCDKAFAAEHDVGVFEAGEGQTEVIEPAIQRFASNGDAEIGDLGEVRQAHAARRMFLAEDHFPIRAVHC